jgi:hypothetical protein
VFGHVPTQLSDLDFTLELTLEASKQDFPLSGLETVTEARNGSGAISDRELDKLLVDEILVPEGLLRMVHIVVDGVGGEPFLPAISHLLVKSKLDHIIVLLVLILELNQMIANLRKILLGLLRGGGTQTFVVLDFPLLKVAALSPLLKLVLGEEGFDLISLGGLEERGHELFKEAVHVHQRGPEVMNKVYQQALDVRAVVILISHDHN